MTSNSVVTKRRAGAASTVLCAVLLQACVISDVTRFCSFSASPSLREANRKSLGIVLGWPGAARMEDAYVMLYSPSMAQPELTLRVDLVAAAIPWPSELDETRCRKLDWRTYRVQIDPEKWGELWNRPGFVSFETGFAYTDPSASPGKSLVSLKSFAMAWVDTTTGEPIMSCGCYHT
jgi:hypothetical protein